MILKHNDDKNIYNYEDIIKQFEEPICVSLSENKNSVSGVALCKISTMAQYSKKLQYNFFPRQYMSPGQNIVREVNKIATAMREQKEPETFDI